MANASNATSRIGLVKESTFNTTPTTPELTAQRFASASFTIEKPELLDDSKTGTRQYQYTQTGNKTITGTLEGPFAHENFDTLLESCFYNTFNSNVLKFGDTINSVTLEEAQPDIGVYRQYTGTIVNAINIEAPIDGLVTASFELLSMTDNLTAATIDNNGAYTAQAVRQPFTHCGGNISEGGSPIAYANSVSLSITNNLAHTFAWGGCSPADIIPGRVDVTGTLDVFFTSPALINKFLNGTSTSLSFTLSDGVNTLTFNLPKIKYTGADAPIDSGSGERLVSLPFRALYDPVLQSTVVVTRSA